MRSLKDEAMTPLIGLIIGVVLFSASFYYVADTALKVPQETGRADEATLSSLAVMIADALMAKGSGWFTSTPCSAGAENTATFYPDGNPANGQGVGAVDGSNNPLGRFGLGVENCALTSADVGSANNLSFNKFQNVVNALDTTSGSSNGLVDYPEARRSLGLNGLGTDFHIRTWPVLDSISLMLQNNARDPNVRPAYIGDYDGATKKAKAPVPDEIRYSDTVVVEDNFQPNIGINDAQYLGGAYSIAYAANGDVFPDDGVPLHAALKPLLCSGPGGAASTSIYNTLVIGSDVDPAQLYNKGTNGHANCAAGNPHTHLMIADWVKAGGTLMVYRSGNGNQDVDFLEPFAPAEGDTPNNPPAPTAPDPSYPLLNVPNDLSWEGYLHPSTWKFNPDSNEYRSRFTHVVRDANNADKDQLMVSVNNRPDIFGSGKVILTAWRPYQLVTDQATVCPPGPTPPASCPALQLVQNLITIHYRTVFLDYGPPLPERSTIVSTVRVGSLFHPDLNKVIAIQMQVFVFQGGS